MQQTIGRFAPTPSGRMHLGNILCALCAWSSIRQKNGQFFLRIEDLDSIRYHNSDCIAQIFEDLAWLGITYDNSCSPDTYQSNRSPLYQEHLHHLGQKALIYPCYCSRDQLHAATAPHTEDGQTLYPGTCLSYLSTKNPPKKSSSLRIHMPNRVITFSDHLQSEYSQNLKTDCGDFILRRADGIFSYQFAVVIDDGLSGINEVVRGRDLLSSTPRQIWLSEQLGFPIPNYYHIPLLCDHEGNRLAKRNGTADLGHLRKQGFHAEEIIGLLAYTIGFIHNWEALTIKEFQTLFSWDQLKKPHLYLPKTNIF